jgi:hypothetical protein
MISERKEQLSTPRVLNIGFDLDGVLANLKSPLGERFLDYGVDINMLMWQKLQASVPIPFDFGDWPEVQEAGLTEIFNQMLTDESLYLAAEPIRPMVDLVEHWHQEGHAVFIISSRPQELAQVTQYWLQEVAGLGWFEEEQLFLNPQHPQYDLGSGFKPGLARQLKLHLFFEDYFESLLAIDHPEMCLKVLLRYPYNQQAEILPGTVSLGSIRPESGGIDLFPEEIQKLKDLVEEIRRRPNVAQY